MGFKFQLVDIMNQYNSKIFLEDLVALKFSIERKDFESANSFSNRIMGNAYLFDEKIFGLTGFFFKELAREGAILNQLKTRDKEIINSTKSKIISLIDLISKDTSSINLDLVWRQYVDVTNSARFEKLNEDEKQAYSESIEFSENLANKIYKILLENRELLSDPSNDLLTGSLSEIIRVIDVYAASKHTMYFLGLLIMLIRVQEYVRTTSNESNYVQRVKDELLPFLDSIGEKIKSFDNTAQQNIVNDCLWDLICAWRLYFIKYHEPRQNMPKRRSALKEQTKSKIADALSQSLEKEIGGEK